MHFKTDHFHACALHDQVTSSQGEQAALMAPSPDAVQANDSGKGVAADLHGKQVPKGNNITDPAATEADDNQQQQHTQVTSTLMLMTTQR
jgi:hypothetical protein